VANRTEKEVRRIAPFLLGILLLGNFLLMAYDSRDVNTKERTIRVWAQSVATFVQTPITKTSSFFADNFQFVSGMYSAASENEQLHQRIQELETEVAGLKNAAEENERLNSLLNLSKQSQYKTLAAQIIGRDPSIWFDMITIDKGRLAGVEINMPVVTNDGVVGRVVGTSPLTAQILLLTDDKGAASAIVGELGVSNALGAVRGTGKELLEMRYVSGQIPVNVGEVVKTTGQDGIYPPGLKIGDVVDVRQGSATTPHTIYVKPSVNIGSLQEVAVLLYHAPARPKLDQTVPNLKVPETNADDDEEKP
jgi:rod shape-determining protein MreC